MSRHGNSTKLVEDCVQGISRLVEKKILFFPKDLVGLVLFGTTGTCLHLKGCWNCGLELTRTKLFCAPSWNTFRNP